MTYLFFRMPFYVLDVLRVVHHYRDTFKVGVRLDCSFISKTPFDVERRLTLPHPDTLVSAAARQKTPIVAEPDGFALAIVAFEGGHALPVTVCRSFYYIPVLVHCIPIWAKDTLVWVIVRCIPVHLFPYPDCRVETPGG